MKMEQKDCSETSAYKILMPGNHPKKEYNNQNTVKVSNHELGKFLSQCHLKSTIDPTQTTLGLNPVLQCLKDGNQLPQPWHVLSNDHVFLVSHTKCCTHKKRFSKNAKN
jgi:hypothetical protein